MQGKGKKLLLCLGIPLAVGGLATLLTREGMKEFHQLVQPPLSPPGWVFALVWPMLYLLMGYASYRMASSGAPREPLSRAWSAYGWQLGLNFLWTILFFGLGWHLVALAILGILWGAILLTILRFSRIDSLAGDLLLPYLLWVTFAAYLNYGVYCWNR